MTRARGGRLQNALAGYLTRWWPHAESAGAGRQGTDVLGTPGVVWECKTAMDFKRDFKPTAWVRQSQEHGCNCTPTCRPMCEAPSGALPVVVYFPAGIGKENTGNALAILPVHVLMSLLEDAGYTPDPAIAGGSSPLAPDMPGLTPELIYGLEER